MLQCNKVYILPASYLVHVPVYGCALSFSESELTLIMNQNKEFECEIYSCIDHRQVKTSLNDGCRALVT